MKPLKGLKVVSMAVNLPGPLAAARFAAMGAHVVKVQTPAGDPLETFRKAWFDEIHANQEIKIIDAKKDIQKIYDLLASADLFLTAYRPASLERLGLDWPTLHQKFPKLCQVAIVGYVAPSQNQSSHDLTCQAHAGLLKAGEMPRFLLADTMGAEQAVSTALSLLFQRQTLGHGAYAEVALSQAAESFKACLKYGATDSSQILGGASPLYNIYETKKGWIALAAIEEVFQKRLKDELKLTELSKKSLNQIFKGRTALEWEEWAKQKDIPIAELRSGKSV